MSEAATSTPQVWDGPEDEWYFLVDPAWRATDELPEPPPEAVVGGWFADEDGELGFFQPNPGYQPSVPGLPTDPVDAALQLLSDGSGEGSRVLEHLQQIVLSVAVDEENAVVVTPAPDEQLSVLVATAPAHRKRVDAPEWAELTVQELAEVLPDEGLDVLLNPGAPASVRVHGGALKQWLAGEFEEAEDAEPAEAAETAEASGAAEGDETTGDSGAARI